MYYLSILVPIAVLSSDDSSMRGTKDIYFCELQEGTNEGMYTKTIAQTIVEMSHVVTLSKGTQREEGGWIRKYH